MLEKYPPDTLVVVDPEEKELYNYRVPSFLLKSIKRKKMSVHGPEHVAETVLAVRVD